MIKVPKKLKPLAAALAVLAVPASSASVVTSPVVVQRPPGWPSQPTQPTQPVTQWTQRSLAVGEYAFVKSQGPCCSGIVVHLVEYYPSSGMWATTFFQDVSGNFPSSNPYWQAQTLYFNAADLQGLSPA